MNQNQNNQFSSIPEDLLTPQAMWDYVYAMKKPYPPGEAILAQSARTAYWYAKYILGPGKRFIQGEAAIMTDMAYAPLYAIHQMKSRWEEIEHKIILMPSISRTYASAFSLSLDLANRRFVPIFSAVSPSPTVTDAKITKRPETKRRK